MADIEFWFSVGSTYSYLTVMRLRKYSEQTGVSFAWRPFNVRAIMREMENIPFANKPVKASYMWRDVGRRAAMYGLRPRLPAPYPLKELERANRVAVIAAAEGWLEDYAEAAYRGWFDHGDPAGSEPNISGSIRAAGRDPATVLTAADGAEGETALAVATDEARKRGVFGSPTFFVGDEMFWGDDRLDDAVNWLRSGKL